ncbi:hypothetical protein ACRRTK_008994 [Alexandromys fortis]
MTEEKDKGHPVRAEILGDTMPKSKAHSSPGRPWQRLRISDDRALPRVYQAIRTTPGYQ